MPNRQTRYGLRSNIPQLTGQALFATCYDVQEPVRMPTYERRRFGSIFSRNVFQEYDEEKLQQFAFTSETYFPALAGYVGVINLNNAPTPPDGAGDPITFTLNKVYENDYRDPTAVLEHSHLVIDNILITGYEPNNLPRGNENQTHTLTGIVTAWRKYWNPGNGGATQLLERYSQMAELLESYLPDGGTPPSWTLVDHLKPIRDALNASIA